MLQHLARRAPRGGIVTAGVALAALTMATHLTNFGFTIAGGRLLTPSDFGTLTALLGITLVGMAPGMAVQALTAAGTLGGPVHIDAPLARRLAAVIGVVVVVLLVIVGPGIGTTHPVAILGVTAGAALLPLTGANEGVLQGQGRFTALGLVLLTGALVKFTIGGAGMFATRAVWAAAVGIGLGYSAQLWLSHRLTGGLDDGKELRRRVSATVVTAVVMMGLLLVLIHVDAVLAQILLHDLAAGQYAVGVTGTRIVFWAPQFAVYLLYPRLVTDHRRRVVAAAIGGLTLAGTVGAIAASLVGPWLVRVVFGAEFEPIGIELWRFAWLGTTAIGLQILALSDLATGRREAMWLLGTALVTVVGVLLGVRPATPVGVITTVAGILTAFVAIGFARRLVHPAPEERTRPAFDQDEPA